MLAYRASFSALTRTQCWTMIDQQIAGYKSNFHHKQGEDDGNKESRRKRRRLANENLRHWVAYSDPFIEAYETSKAKAEAEEDVDMQAEKAADKLWQRFIKQSGKRKKSAEQQQRAEQKHQQAWRRQQEEFRAYSQAFWGAEFASSSEYEGYAHYGGKKRGPSYNTSYSNNTSNSNTSSSSSSSYTVSAIWRQRVVSEQLKTLGLQADGPNGPPTAHDLKLAFRKCAMMHHPDRHPDEEKRKLAEQRFKAAQSAYDALLVLVNGTNGSSSGTNNGFW